jgi:small-conductance mechanosensitive channel
MISLGDEIGSWLGLLLRPSVLVQWLPALVLVVTYLQVLAPRLAARRPNWRSLGGIGLWLVLLLVALLIGITGLPNGLALYLSQIIGIWTLLSLLRTALLMHGDHKAVNGLFTRVIRPLYALLASLALLNQIDSLTSISRLELARFLGTPLTLESLLLLITMPYFLVVISPYPAMALSWLLQLLSGFNQTSRRASELVLRYVLIGLGAIWILKRIGLNTTALAAIAGGLSVGLGISIKDVFANFISGLWLLFEGSVRPGDVVVVDGDACEVRQLHLRAAVLWRDRDNAELVVPNQIFFTDKTITYTGTDRLRRIEVLVGAAYRHRPDDVCRLMNQAMASCQGVLHEPTPVSLVQDYGDSAITYSARCWISDPMQSVNTSSRVRSAIWDSFQAHGIEIPFPQRVIQWPQPPEQEPGG